MELSEISKVVQSNYEELNQGTLLILDEDLRVGTKSLEDVDIHSLRMTDEDMKYCRHCEYVGKFGRKVLKSRSDWENRYIPEDSPRITRKELGIHYS